MNDGFWIGVRAFGISSFHWLDGSPLAGLFFVYARFQWDTLL